MYFFSAVLQFVPIHIDTHACMFIERIERGLIYAFAEVRRRLKESTDIAVQVRITSKFWILICLNWHVHIFVAVFL